MLSLLFVGLLALPSPASNTLHVPGDAATLQEAIDLAVDGDVILVQTNAFQEPVVVDKPLSIVGDPWANVLIGFEGNCFLPAFRLDGPGTGTVNLVAVRTGTGTDCLFPPNAVAGGGFDELFVHDSDIRAAASGLTGLGYGSAAIAVDTPLVSISGSTVVGGADNADDCLGFLPGGGYPAVDAPTSTVLVLDSTLSGGSGGFLCCKFCACPPSIAGLGGEGGVGVICDELYTADSVVEGGTGSTFLAYSGPPIGPGENCGKQPDGTAFLTGSHETLASTLRGSGSLRLNTSYTLRWDTPATFAALYVASGLALPQPLIGGAQTFLAPDAQLIGIFPGGTNQTLVFVLPNATVLLGLPVAFQLLDSNLTGSRPVAGIIQR